MLVSDCQKSLEISGKTGRDAQTPLDPAPKSVTFLGPRALHSFEYVGTSKTGKLAETAGSAINSTRLICRVL